MKKNMYRYLLIFSGCLLAGFSLRAQQLKLGSNPTMINKTALLEMESSNQGLLLPRISDTNAFHPNPIPNGMLIYYVGASDSCLMIRKDGTWVKIVDFVNLSARETDPIATARTVTVNPGTGISVTGGTQTLGSNPTFTVAAKNTSPIWNADSLQNVKVSATAPTNKQLLAYNAASSAWTPTTIDTSYITNFPQNVRNLFSQGTGINYNATTGQITNAGVTSFNGRTGAVTPANADYNLSQLGDVNITFTSLANGQLLQYNGTNWVNSTPNFLTPSNVSGTTNYVAKFMGSNTLGNSQIFDNGTNVGIGTASPGAKLDVSGNINLSGGGNTVSSSSTELIMQETGDTYGTVRLHLQNRTGLNGALFENPALDLVDFGFRTNSGAQQNLRFEHRTSNLYNSNNTSGEFQFGLFGSPDNPNFIIGSYATFVRNGRFGINTNSPDSLLTVNGSSHFTGNLRLDAGLSINGNYGSAGQVLVSQGTGTAPAWTTLSSMETDPIATAKTVTVNPGTGISVTGLFTQALGSNPSFTVAAKNTSPIWNADSLQSVKVSATAPTNKQLLAYNAASSAWTPTTIDTSYITNFQQNVRNLFSQGTGISYNATTGQISSLLGNVTITNPTNGQLLQYNGSSWVNSTPNFLPAANVSGTTNYVAKFTGSNTLGNSQIFDNGTNVGIGLTNPETRLVVKDTLYIRNTSGGGTSKPSMLIFTNTSGNSGNGVFRIGGDGGDIFWQGGAGQCLQMGAYWPMIFMGNIQIPNGYFPNYVPGNTTWNGLNLARIGVAIIAQHYNDVPLVIRGVIGASQTANLTEWYNSNGTRVAYVDSGGNLYGASFKTPSDKRLKTNLHPLTEVLSKIGEIHSYTFYYKQNIAGRQFPSTKQIGMIAQEVEKYFPELVSTDDQGYKALNYAQFTAVLLEAVKEQQAEIEKLQQENQQLKNELNIRISSLENKLKELLQSEVKNK